MKARITRRRFLKTGGAGVVATAVIPSEYDPLRAKQKAELTTRGSPDFEGYATVEAYADEVPVYSLGNIVFLYGVSPNFLSDVVMQNGHSLFPAPSAVSPGPASALRIPSASGNTSVQ